MDPKKVKRGHKRSLSKPKDSSVSPYSSSLPSPPYSEENYSSDESDLSANMASRMSGSSTKNFDRLSSACLKQSSQNQGHFAKREQHQSQSISYNVKKLYPNLMKVASNATSDSMNTCSLDSFANKLDSGNKKPNRGKSKGSPQKSNPPVSCNVCNYIVNGTESCLRKHLIFGHVKCLECGWVEEHCTKFSKFHFELKYSQGCQHRNLKWIGNPVDNFRSWVNRDMYDADEEMFRNALGKYIILLHPLRDLAPWKTAIDMCESYLKKQLHEDAVNAIEGNSESSSAPKKSKKNKKETSTEYINVPANGFYLIIKQAIEECPNCYEKLPLKYLEFSIPTWLIKFKCRGCALVIFFVLDPPDGSEPKITIVKD